MINTKRLSLSHVALTVDNGAMFYSTFTENNFIMALAHTLGFPRIGADRKVKKALEAHGKRDPDQQALKRVDRPLRAAHWQLQKDAGIDLLPIGDFAWDDEVLTAQELTKWFDTNYHHLVPEFSAEQSFSLSWEQLFDEVEEARTLGYNVKPVIIGPLTYLWLGKVKFGGDGNDFDKLDLLERLLPVYNEILVRLAGQGVEWVQIDEPILTLDLPQAWKNAFERAYHILQYSPLKKLVATHFSGEQDNIGLVVGLPVQGLHIDAVRAPDQLGQVLDRLPTYKILSVGLVNARNLWRCELEQALAQLQPAQERFGDNLWVSSSSSLLHSQKNSVANTNSIRNC